VSLIIGMAILTAAGMVAIWAPGYPAPERHEHMRAMDRLRDDDPFPHGRCWCGAALDGRGICEDGASCARDGWDR
jgi:hypothetical protein